MTLRKVREFTTPTDERTGRQLTRQLGELEQNCADETAAIRKETLPLLVSQSLSESDGGVVLAPGQSIGVDTSGGDVEVVLIAPEAKHSGKLAAVYKRSASNTLTLRPQGDALINGASSLSVTALGLRTILCESGEYWA